MKYDVFVSYRRTSFESANLIAEKLRSMGYSIFFDVETLRAGNFNEQLFDVIDNCQDFVLVLPPNALDKCSDENDWVRKEVLRAIASKKNIIPVMLSGFTFPSPMPQGLEILTQYQAIMAGEQEFFDLSMKRLAGYLKSKPHRDLRKFYKKITFAAITLLALAGIALGALYMFAKPLYKDVAINATSCAGALNILYGEMKKVPKTWNEFVEEYEEAKTKERKEELRLRYIDAMEHMTKEVDFYYNQFIRLPKFSSFQTTLLNLHDIGAHEIEALYSIYDITYHDVKNQYKYAIATLSNPKVVADDDLREHNTIYINGSSLASQAFTDSVFYAYLELMSKFPKHAHEFYKTQCPGWTNFPPTVGLTLSIDEYRVLQDTAAKKSEKIVAQLEADVAKLRGEIKSEREVMERVEAEKHSNK